MKFPRVIVPLINKVLNREISSVLLTRKNAASATLSFKIIGQEKIDPEIPPIFILHGLLGMKKHWRSVGKTLVNMTKRPVVLVDLRNHGDSPRTASHKYQELANDVIQLFEKLSVKKACLIGHSMGGRTSMCISLMTPEKVANLLVIDISPVSSPQHLTEFMPRVLSVMNSIKLNRKNLKSAQKEVKRQLKDIVNSDLMQVILSNIRMKNEKIGWLCNVKVLSKYMSHIASFPQRMHGKQYNGPTLFVGGQLSDYIPPDDLTNIRVFFPQAVIHYIPSAGHHPQKDNPKSFIEFAFVFIKNN
ncbi:hypothetical protein ACJJTC_005993 [Scirpophaga incertulas]